MQHNNWSKDRDLLSEAYMTIPVPGQNEVVLDIDTGDNTDHDSDQGCCGDDECSHKEHDSSEIHMALAQLRKTKDYASKIEDIIKSSTSLKGWTASKITKASDYLSSVYHWLDYDENKDDHGSPDSHFNAGHEDYEEGY